VWDKPQATKKNIKALIEERIIEKREYDRRKGFVVFLQQQQQPIAPRKFIIL
jgi:hypothetical protein